MDERVRFIAAVKEDPGGNFALLCPEVVRATASEYGRNKRRASAKAKAAALPKDKLEPKPSPEPDLDPTEEDMDDTDA